VNNLIYQRVLYILKKYSTRDPFVLLNALGAVTVYSDSFTSLKGYCAILNRISYAVINAKLPDEEKRIAAGHEAAHLVLHKNEIRKSPTGALRDFSFFNNNASHLEFEANSFLADFLISDDSVTETRKDNPDGDFFSYAADLSVPPQLYAFKLNSMQRRGMDVENPVGLEAGFLRRV